MSSEKEDKEKVGVALSTKDLVATFLLYSRKLSREKTFANFAVLWLFAKVFSAKFGGLAFLAWHKRAICE